MNKNKQLSCLFSVENSLILKEYKKSQKRYKDIDITNDLEINKRTDSDIQKYVALSKGGKSFFKYI